MAGRELDDSVREQATAQMINEDRVRLRLKPYATFVTPQNETEFAKLTHWTSSTIPWDAE